MFDKMKGMYELQKKAREIQKNLKKTTFVGESRKGDIKVTVNGIQEVIDIEIDEESKNQYSPQSLGSEIKEALNKAMKKSQQHGSAKMREISGDLGFPGM
jgi:nucleoid-associated protein EbfC